MILLLVQFTFEFGKVLFHLGDGGWIVQISILCTYEDDLQCRKVGNTYICVIVSLYEIPFSIISNRGTSFSLNFLVLCSKIWELR